MMEHKIELTFGYVDKDGTRHKDVTFGRRLLTGDIIQLDNDPQGQNPTQYADLIRRRMITAFGTEKMPVPLNVLLSLNSVDREDLQAGADKYLEMSRDDRPTELRENNVVQTRFGFVIDGTEYSVIEIGKLTTGRDEVDADTIGKGVARECFLLGRMITKISTSDGAASIDGPVELETFTNLDAEDLNILRIGARIAEQSFRLKGKELSSQRDGEGSPVVDEGNRDERSGDPGPAAEKN